MNTGEDFGCIFHEPSDGKCHEKAPGIEREYGCDLKHGHDGPPQEGTTPWQMRPEFWLFQPRRDDD